MVFGNGVKTIQAAAYNGARTVLQVVPLHTKRSPSRLIIIQPDPDNLSVYSLPHQISKKKSKTPCCLPANHKILN